MTETRFTPGPRRDAMTTEYLDLPLRSLRQVRDDALAEYRKLAREIKIQRWSAKAERAAAQSAYTQLKHRLDALNDRLEFLDEEIAHRERAHTPDGL